MKRIILFLLCIIVIGQIANAQETPIQNPEFIHTTYIVGGSFRSKQEINQSNYGQFKFIYLMAAPQWNRLDFDVPIDSIYKYVDTFSYGKENSGMTLVPAMVNKSHTQKSKVLLSFAGEGFNPIVENSSRRTKFIKLMARFINKYDYDGIEIDWETGFEIQLHATFMHEIRSELNKLATLNNKKYYLTTALQCYQRYNQELANKISEDIDWINIMTYDMGGGIWGHVPTHNTPLKDIKSILERWNVFSPKKLCIGMANYGFRYKNVAPGERVEKSLSEYGRYFNYNDLLPLLHQGWTEEYDSEQQVSYYFSPDRKEFITMENPNTILTKIEWITAQGYLGAFWWQFHCDFNLPNDTQQYGTHHLMDVVSNYLDTSNHPSSVENRIDSAYNYTVKDDNLGSSDKCVVRI